MRVHDGAAIEFVAPTGGVVADEFYRISGFNLIAVTDAAEGETFAGEIHPAYVYRVKVPAGVTANKGSILYIPSAGAVNTDLTNTVTANIPALLVTEAKDAGHVCEARLINGQPTDLLV